MKILWIVPKWTLPATDGARVASETLIRNTASSGAIIDYLCVGPAKEFGDPELLKSRFGVRNIFVVDRDSAPRGIKKYFYYLRHFLHRPLTPLTFASFSESKTSTQVLKHTKNDNYDHIVFDGLHLGACFMNDDSAGAKYIYRAHNLESELWKTAKRESNNLLLKLMLSFQGHLVQSLEERIIQLSDAVACIAVEDKDKIETIGRNKNLKHIPLGLNFSKSLPSSSHGPIKFLFFGRLDWAPNKDALTWLLKEVWPSVIQRRPDAVLKVAGSGDSRWIHEYSLSGVELVGFVKDVKEAYEDVQYAIVPMRFGSGTRIKVLESFIMNRKLISTATGVQGALLRECDYICAESAQDWIKTLSEVEYMDKLEDELNDSRAYLEAIYCEKKIGQDFYHWLSTLS